jgi:predicted phosphodiesterase
MFAAAGALAALAALPFVSGTYPVGPGEVQIRARPSFPGATVVALPPLGAVEARTHLAPLRLTLSPASVDIPDLGRLLRRRPDAKTLQAGLEKDRNRGLLRFGLWLLVVGTLAGAAAFAVLRGGRKQAAAAVFGGAIVPVVLYAAALAGFDPEAFREPILTGALSRAPQLVGPVEQLQERFEIFREEISELGSAAFSIYEFVSDQSAVPDDAIRILHISDLHLNPVGYDVARRVAEEFHVVAVFDTGDLTAEGTEIEAGFANRIREFGVPYVFVRGNHDSLTTERAVRSQPNAVVLEGTSVQIEGLTIFGVGDPLFTPDKSVERTTDDQREAKEAFADEVPKMLNGADVAPDVVLVHDRQIAGKIFGEVPLVLSGHGHRWYAGWHEETLVLQAGSTGGAGIQTFADGSKDPISLQVLYFDRVSKRLIAYDRVEFVGPKQEFSLTRSLVEGEAA